MSSITKQEPLIKEVGIKKLKARFQKAAETGETIDALRWFMAMTFVSNDYSVFYTRYSLYYRMSLVHCLLVIHLTFWKPSTILSSLG
jgi:hypothetical protein